MATSLSRNNYDKYLSKPLEIPIPNADLQNSIGGVTASSLTDGGLVTTIRVGVNGQIIINDGSNDRVLIGYQKNGF